MFGPYVSSAVAAEGIARVIGTAGVIISDGVQHHSGIVSGFTRNHTLGRSHERKTDRPDGGSISFLLSDTGQHRGGQFQVPSCG
jgi:hypothetical protein